MSCHVQVIRNVMVSTLGDVTGEMLSTACCAVHCCLPYLGDLLVWDTSWEAAYALKVE